MFKHILSLTLALILILAGTALADTVRVAVVQPLTHTSLNQIRDTIVSKLEASDIDFEIVTKNAEGDSAALSSILENVKNDGVDILVPIATSTAQSAKMVFDGTDVSVVFAAVSDPVAAGLTGDDCGFITGVSNNIPAAEIVNLISDFQISGILAERYSCNADSCIRIISFRQRGFVCCKELQCLTVV